MRFAVDTGGTFTDCIAEAPGGGIVRTKVLSHGHLSCTVGAPLDALSFRIETSWKAPDDFPVGFVVRFPRQPDYYGEVAAYQAASGKLFLTAELPFTP